MPPLPPATPSPPVEPEPLMRLSISLAALAAMMKLVEEEAVRGEVESAEGKGGLPGWKRMRCRS